MHKRTEMLVVLVSSFALFTWGCDGNDDNDDDSKDTGTQTEDAGDANDGGTENTNQNVTCDPSGDGKCQNEADCPIIEKGTARQTATQCGMGCLGVEDPTECSEACVVEQTGLTDDCTACYVGIVDCTFEKCASACSNDSGSLDCFNCQVDEGCRETFNTCSGLPESPAPSE